MRLLRIEVISSGLICMQGSLTGAAPGYACATCLRSWFRRFLIDASRMKLPTRSTMPPRMSGSTPARELDLAAGLLADPLADALDRRLVELDGARDLDRQQLVLLRPRAGRTRSGCGRSPASGGVRPAPRGSS